MAPISSSDPPNYDMYLILTFPRLSSLISAPPATYLEAVSNAAKHASSLLVLVRFVEKGTSPWSAHGSSASSVAQASTSSSSAPSTSNASSPFDAWTALEHFFAQVYGAATRVYMSRDELLAKVDVVIEEMRGINFCVPSGAQVERVDVPDDVNGPQQGSESRPLPAYPVSALGGTFDHLHAGHKILLTMAASITARKLIVGVTDAELLVTKKHSEYLETLETRTKTTQSFLELIRPTIEHFVVPIQDPYGPTAYEPDVQALVVSEETRSGGEAVNKKRQESSLSTLDVSVINLVADDADTAATVSAATKLGSTGIRGWLAKKATAADDQKK